MEEQMIAVTTVHLDRKSPGLIIRLPKRIAQEIGWKDKQQVIVETDGTRLLLRTDGSQ